MEKIDTFSVLNLSIKRGDRSVLRGLGFNLISGLLLKLIGPNGSGKSTLLKTLAGLIDIEEGDVLSDGISVMGNREWIARNICYLSHKNALKSEFTVLENIKFWADLWGCQNKILYSLNQMGIDYLRDTPVRYLSSGQARRVALARSLCHPAALWLYDEPTVGIDDQGLDYLSIAMEKHLAGGGMIICATHDNLRIKDEIVKNFDVTKFSVSLSSSGDDWS